MQKRTIILTSVITILLGSLMYNVNANTTNNEVLQNRYSASQSALKQKEQEYKEQNNILKKILSDTKQSSEKERAIQIDKVSKIIKELELEREKSAILIDKLNSLQEDYNKLKVQVTQKDMPDFSDTSKITNIDIDVINKKFKGGALEGDGKLLVSVALNHNISPHFFTALIALESGYGKSKLAKHKNNFGGIKSSKNVYRSFDSKEEGLNYIASLIQRKYHNEGRISIASIQKRYAPSWDGNKGWSKKIQIIMTQLHKEAMI